MGRLGHDQNGQTVDDGSDSPVTHVFHTDGLVGSTTFLTDLTGAVLHRYAYDALGSAIGFDPAAVLNRFPYFCCSVEYSRQVDMVCE